MNRLVVSPSPHIHTANSTTRIMLDVILAMVPAIVAGVVFFGPSTLLVEAVAVASCVIFEWLTRLVMKRANTISDLSAVVTGLLLAFNMPPTIPLWIVVVGSFFAIVIAKQLFGGIGQNFANPAIVGRIVLFISFGTQMTNWVAPMSWMDSTDAVASVTPLAMGVEYSNTMDLFLGRVGGCIGEISALALLLGGAYLVLRKVINPVIPVVFIGTVFVCTWLFSGDLGNFVTPLNSILAGGVMLGAIFMATDYSTSPTTTTGKLIFAFGCGLITVLIRMFGSYPEGVSFSILIMNLLTPLLDRIGVGKPFGVVENGGAKRV